MGNILKINKENIFYCICKGVAIAIILSVICIFIYAVVLANTSVTEQTITPVVLTITGISILIGSSISSVKIKKNGILNGAFVGGLYILILYVLSSIAFCGFGFNLKSIIMIAIGIACGAIGGIIGVNMGR